MSHPGPSTKHAPQFRTFWSRIAGEVGDAWLVLDEQASSIRNFIDLSNDPKGYLREVIRQSYRRSQCHHLGSPISIETVLDILGETAFALQDDKQDDLCDIELLEEIAWHIGSRYGHLIERDEAADSSPRKGVVVSFPSYKIRRANARF